MLEINNLKKSYSGRELFKGINFELRIGSRTAIIGDTGSGKSVLLETILGYRDFTTGTVLFENKKLPYENMDRVLQLRSRVGYISTEDLFLKDTTIYNNIKWICGASDGHIIEIASAVGLSTELYKSVKKLSKLQIWRLKLALSSFNSQLLLLDNPLSDLEFSEAIEYLRTVIEFCEVRNCGLLVTTDSEDLIKEFRMDKVYKLEDGVLL
jgi:ABC-type multidrug transport system ATPase subunit